jgi:hypothetical protein
LKIVRECGRRPERVNLGCERVPLRLEPCYLSNRGFEVRNR